MFTVLSGKNRDQTSEESTNNTGSVEATNKPVKAQCGIEQNSVNNDAQRKFVSHLQPSSLQRKVSSKNMFFMPAELADSTEASPSDKYLADFSLLKDSGYWEKFKSSMVRLIPIASDHIKDLDILPAKIFLTEDKLQRYLFERDKEKHVYAYGKLLDFIRTEIWLKYLEPTLRNLQNKISPNSAQYKEVVDNILEKIINTYCLNTCADEGEHNKILIGNDILRFEELPKEIHEYFSTNHVVEYHQDFAKLLQLVEGARKINKNAQSKVKTDLEVLTEERVDLSYHFILYDKVLEKFSQYLAEHYSIKDKKLKNLIEQLDKCKLFDLIFEVLATAALEKQTNQFIPELSSKPLREKLYINNKYLHGLFKLISEQFLALEKDAKKVLKSGFANYPTAAAETIVSSWLAQITHAEPIVKPVASFHP